MKVDVTQVDDVKFPSRFSWWSQWIDIAVYDFSFQPYLVQMRISRTNKKSFRSVKMVGSMMNTHANAATIGDLIQMKK